MDNQSLINHHSSKNKKSVSKVKRKRKAKNGIEVKISFKKGVRLSNFRAPKLLKKHLVEKPEQQKSHRIIEILMK
jgi:maltose-binding protein MalE